MATRMKPAKKARNNSRDYIRNARGTGRKPVASIMVPLEIKEKFDCFKVAYAAREGSATNEQVLRRWMDGIGSSFDSKLAQEARRLFRQRLQAAKAARTTDNDENGCNG